VTFRSLSPQSARGRQAEARRNDLAVLDAARDVFAAQGAGAPISAVAASAGVGMGTLYRRYGSKTELLQRLCVLAMEQAIEAADEALQAGDPWAGLCGYIQACVEMRSGALASLAQEASVLTSPRWTSRCSSSSSAAVPRARPAARTLIGKKSAASGPGCSPLPSKGCEPKLPHPCRAGRPASRGTSAAGRAVRWLDRPDRPDPR